MLCREGVKEDHKNNCHTSLICCFLRAVQQFQASHVVRRYVHTTYTLIQVRYAKQLIYLDSPFSREYGILIPQSSCLSKGSNKCL